MLKINSFINYIESRECKKKAASAAFERVRMLSFSGEKEKKLSPQNRWEGYLYLKILVSHYLG